MNDWAGKYTEVAKLGKEAASAVSDFLVEYQRFNEFFSLRRDSMSSNSPWLILALFRDVDPNENLIRTDLNLPRKFRNCSVTIPVDKKIWLPDYIQTEKNKIEYLSVRDLPYLVDGLGIKVPLVLDTDKVKKIVRKLRALNDIIEAVPIPQNENHDVSSAGERTPEDIRIAEFDHIVDWRGSSLVSVARAFAAGVPLEDIKA